jgi:hypothetical protein
MTLHHREDFEIIKDVFELIKNEYIQYEEYSNIWKRELAREIKQLIEIHENKTVKEESVLRNINRMLAYYENRTAQARSGKRYLKYFEIILQERFNLAYETAFSLGGGVAQRFMTLEDARLYIADIEVLKVYFNPQDKLFYVLRYPSQ